MFIEHSKKTRASLKVHSAWLCVILSSILGTQAGSASVESPINSNKPSAEGLLKAEGNPISESSASTDVKPGADNSASANPKPAADSPVAPQGSGSNDSSKSAGTEQSKCKKKRASSVTSMLTWINPEKEQKAAILCVHGLGLYNNTYEKFGKAMADRGYAMYAMDVPGFGSFQNKAEKQKIDFDACLVDMEKTIKLIRRSNPKLPVFVLGESMGGAIVLRFTAEHPNLVDGMISSVPSGDRFKQNKEKFRVGLKLLTAPNKEFDIGTSVVERATNDPKLQKAWSGDRLNRLNLSPKDLVQFQNFMNDNHDSAKLIKTTPVLFVQGCKDKLVRPEGTVSLFNRIQCSDKQLELIHDAEHLIFEEGQFDDHVIQIVDTWLGSHLNSSKQITSK